MEQLHLQLVLLLSCFKYLKENTYYHIFLSGHNNMEQFLYINGSTQ